MCVGQMHGKNSGKSVGKFKAHKMMDFQVLPKFQQTVFKQKCLLLLLLLLKKWKNRDETCSALGLVHTTVFLGLI